MKKQIENIFAPNPKGYTEQCTKTKTNSEINKCPNLKIPIIIDTREKQSLITANLVEKKANIKFEQLEIGDYLIQDTIIERKTFSDFVSSMLDKRLIEQLINLKKYPKHLLIIEGFYYDYNKFNIHENAIRGMLLSIAIDFQVPIILTEDERDTSTFLILAARKYEKPKSPNAIRQSKNFKTLKEQKQFILEGFPGIGPTTAKQLLENFKTLREIFNIPEEQLKKIARFDENKIKKFLELLNC